MNSYFDHERLDVYQAALKFVILTNEIIENLPRGRAYLADQFQRASTSILLNIGLRYRDGLLTFIFIRWISPGLA